MSKNTRFEVNLSEGSVAGQLIRFSLPFLISNLIQSLYAVADMIIVGRFSDINNMSGVHIGNQATFLITNAVIGLCVGGTVLIGQYLGSGKKQELKETISTLFSTLLVLSVVISVVMLLLREPFLNMLKTPAESFSQAKSYLTITLSGTLFIFGYNALSAVMRGMGDSRNPLKFVAIACFTNIALDLLLVAVFDMGAQGAALATVISQGLSMILCIIYLKKNRFVFDFSLSSFRFNGERLKMLFKIGAPTLFNSVAVSTSFLFLTGFANNIGLIASTAVGVVGRFNAFAILPAIAMGSAISAMCAQNFGAGKPERAVKTMKIGLLISISISYSIFILTQLFPEELLKIFNSDPQLIQAGAAYLRPFSFDYIFVPLLFCLNGLFIGSGHTAFSFINGMLSSLIIRIPVAYIFGIVLDKGLAGIGLGAPFASGLAFVSALLFYFSGRWRKQVIIKNKEL
jgi:putative MATE family efflux protein